ncbi:hypothetical protein D3C80_1808450 [compost metagenome]
MHIHDAHRLALLVIAFRRERQPEADDEEKRRQRGKPRQHAIGQRQKPRRVGEIAELADGQAVFTHDGSLTLKALCCN